jgi:hypothetical protein
MILFTMNLINQTALNITDLILKYVRIYGNILNKLFIILLKVSKLD